MYLADKHKLTSDQVGDLLALGWQAPDHPDQNLYRTFHPTGEDDLRAIAEVARRALTEVYGVPRGRPLALFASWRPEAEDSPDGSATGVIPDEPFDFTDYLAGLAVPHVSNTDDGSPVALFVAGGPLSGSTGVVKQLRDDGDELVPADAVIVDGQLIRQMLPEWEAMYRSRDPSTAFMVRAETIDIARKLVVTGCDANRNLLLVGIGAGEEGEFVAIMRSFADAGYEVRVLMADAPVAVELERNEIRASRTGLRFDPGAVERLSIAAAKRHLEWRELEWLTWTLYTTE